jgi:hypothetical protein
VTFPYMLTMLDSTPPSFYLYHSNPYYSTASSVFHYTIFIHRCSVFWYYSLSFPLLPPLVSSNSPTVRNMSYICIYIYIYTYMHVWLYLYLCIHLSFRSSFHIWEETWDLCLSEPGLFQLTWWSPVPFIYLQAA